jgi:hypothetical protein
VPLFLRTLHSPDERSRLQPSLLYATLALATLVRSSELELATQGRTRALWLRNVAQSTLESSWNSSWVDDKLAQAALVSLSVPLDGRTC